MECVDSIQHIGMEPFWFGYMFARSWAIFNKRSAPPRCMQWRPPPTRKCWHLPKMECRPIMQCQFKMPNLQTKWYRWGNFTITIGFSGAVALLKVAYLQRPSLYVRSQAVAGRWSLHNATMLTRSVKHEKGSRTMRRAGGAFSQPVAARIWSHMGILPVSWKSNRISDSWMPTLRNNQSESAYSKQNLPCRAFKTAKSSPGFAWSWKPYWQHGHQSEEIDTPSIATGTLKSAGMTHGP